MLPEVPEQPKILKFAVSCIHFPQVEINECIIMLLKGEFSELQFARWVLEAIRGEIRPTIDADFRCTVLRRDEIPEFIYWRVEKARMLTEDEYEELINELSRQLEDSQF